jgi:hypothetical protein
MLFIRRWQEKEKSAELDIAKKAISNHFQCRPVLGIGAPSSRPVSRVFDHLRIDDLHAFGVIEYDVQGAVDPDVEAVVRNDC